MCLVVGDPVIKREGFENPLTGLTPPQYCFPVPRLSSHNGKTYINPSPLDNWISNGKTYINPSPLDNWISNGKTYKPLPS
jgi:hypothetical protein